MAQILITHSTARHWYTPIASIKQYNEPDFEQKLFRYAESIFENYYVFKFKYGLTCDDIPGQYFEPDLLLVSKTFKKWVIVEVELCKPPTQHTKDQITCFSKPKLFPKDIDSIVDLLIKQNPQIKSLKQNFISCFSDFPSDLIVVLDDYSEAVFNKFYQHSRQLKICVLEVYRRAGYIYDGFRFGGDYPYEVTNSSKLEYIDYQHYKIMKNDFLKDLPLDFEIKFDMEPFKASLFKLNKKTTYLKILDHNIPSDLYLQIGKTTNNEYIIQKL